MSGTTAFDLAPIAVFVYRRPRHTARLIESLLANEPLSRSPVFVYCDGARTAEEQDAVTETRRIVRERLPEHAQVIERNTNMGLAASIITGVTELSRRYGKVIVLEDDLVVHRGCIEFLNAALVHYANDSRVYHVNAYRYPLPEASACSLLRLPSSWGWATWERAWVAFEPDAADLERRILEVDLASAMDFGRTFPYFAMLQKQARGSIDSWAIRWYASVLLRGGLAVYPNVSQVFNGGMDNSGVHCGATRDFDVNVGAASGRWPASTIEDPVTYEQMRVFFRSVRETVARRLARKLKRMLFADRRGG
ncbi:MAG: glycosyltransferase [Proteobacteria bacterium]|nr:glycosyltransferase [Pseudomonadota bacterium]